MDSKKLKHNALAFLGTGSDVGKSICVTAFCRLLKNEGFDLAPFKAQNMSNNSFVTELGDEMGRAQVVQAEASKVTPHSDMNPILLKPSTDTGAQVIVNGQIHSQQEAKSYFSDRTYFKEQSQLALKRLQEKHELILIEGAGSCAEVNLRKNDFVNFETAHAADAPVILIADIDRGGVFAQVIGTLAIIPPQDKDRVKGILINRFRGDITLFEDGVQYIEEHTGLPVLGVIPYFRDIHIDCEDGFSQEQLIDPIFPKNSPAKVKIAIIRLPHISNFTDFATLESDSELLTHYLSRPRDLQDYDLIIVPGSKNVIFDLKWLRDTGWDKILKEALKAGKRFCGICGGFQILGDNIHDPHAIESSKAESIEGLSFIPAQSTLEKNKTLTRVHGYSETYQAEAEGYEIHVGQTKISGDYQAAFTLQDIKSENSTTKQDGYISADRQILASYLHGIFDKNDFKKAYLQSINPDYTGQYSIDKDLQYDKLAEHFKASIKVDVLDKILFE